MGKPLEILISLMMIGMGLLLLIGEWISTGSGGVITSIGLTLAISGFIVLLAIIEHYRGENDA